MLAQLSIRNFALIESLTLEFGRGFNVLTGETGAGKSILIDAITAALGEKVNAELIREGASRASVEAVFEVGEYPLPAVQEWADEGLVILAREISLSGRSACRINGRMCPASTVREVAADLIDIHGQHDHQSLLVADRHVEFLDNWGGEKLQGLRREAHRQYTELRDTHRELQSLLRSERERAQKVDLYRFQADEIDAAAVSPEEEADLLADRTRLGGVERLTAAVTSAREALVEGDASCLDRLTRAVRELEAVSLLDPRTGKFAELLESAVAVAQDTATELRVYLETLEANPERLQLVQDRLETYRLLKRKYGDTVVEIQAFRSRLAIELDSLTHSEEKRDALESRIAQVEAALDWTASQLFHERKAAAARFEAEITRHLGDLNMAGTRFSIRLEAPTAARTNRESGLTTVLGRAEFLISANPGEPLRPLARIASGGEMSRIMLALKSVMAGSHPIALIFDEIDVGVGGRTAETLGAKMAELSRSNQVLCVTHLPQIAAMADRHFQVAKGVAGERTQVEVRLLEGEERVEEVARMLGGAVATASQHARVLLGTPCDARSH